MANEVTKGIIEGLAGIPAEIDARRQQQQQQAELDRRYNLDLFNAMLNYEKLQQAGQPEATNPWVLDAHQKLAAVGGARNAQALFNGQAVLPDDAGFTIDDLGLAIQMAAPYEKAFESLGKGYDTSPGAEAKRSLARMASNISMEHASDLSHAANVSAASYSDQPLVDAFKKAGIDPDENEIKSLRTMAARVGGGELTFLTSQLRDTFRKDNETTTLSYLDDIIEDLRSGEITKYEGAGDLQTRFNDVINEVRNKAPWMIDPNTGMIVGAIGEKQKEFERAFDDRPDVWREDKDQNRNEKQALAKTWIVYGVPEGKPAAMEMFGDLAENRALFNAGISGAPEGRNLDVSVANQLADAYVTLFGIDSDATLSISKALQSSDTRSLSLQIPKVASAMGALMAAGGEPGNLDEGIDLAVGSGEAPLRDLENTRKALVSGPTEVAASHLYNSAVGLIRVRRKGGLEENVKRAITDFSAGQFATKLLSDDPESDAALSAAIYDIETELLADPGKDVKSLIEKYAGSEGAAGVLRSLYREDIK